jgi:hypothetical protein
VPRHATAGSFTTGSGYRGGHGDVPGSLARASAGDAELRRAITNGRREADEDLKSMERWAATGCTSVIEEAD